MSKHYSNRRKTKYILLALACTASFSLTGLAAACTPETNTPDPEKTSSKEDTQLLKNGDFEFFTVPDKKDGENAPEYLINTPTNWTRGGASSHTMSGIISTSDKAWEKITDKGLENRLDENNALVSSASDYKDKYVDFNGMKSSDLLYKDTYAALNKKEGDEGYDTAKDPISNPGTHNIFKGSDGKPYLLDGTEKKTIIENDAGEYFLEYDEAKEEYSQPTGHVLMVHNYATTHNGIEQYYSSIDINLPANTSAEISVWVKTSNLLYHQGEKVQQDRGANISLTHKVGSSSLGDFSITGINTEKLLGGKDGDYNGWVQYTVYVNSCNFAASTVTLKLGLGQGDYPVEGYAFFDDVKVKKYIDLDESTYPQHKDDIEKLTDENNRPSKCSLTSDDSEKVFIADTYERNKGEIFKKRFSESFYYLLDLTAEGEYVPVDFSGATASLTVDSSKYVSSLKGTDNLVGFNSLEAPGKVKLPEELKGLIGGNGLNTEKDFLAKVPAPEKDTDCFTASQTEYYERLNDALTKAKALPNGEGPDNNMIVMLSASGTAYTSSFDITIEEEGYKIISFWVKTSDMGGNAAATIKLTEKDNKENSTSVTLDSTNTVTNIDDDHKDIYNGWVQCFFFVHNEYEKTSDSTPSTLTVEFCFGNTSLSETTVTSYKAGWIALANMQSLDVKEETYAYTGSGDHTASLILSGENKKINSVFDEVYQTHGIENDIADPANYTGVNGGSSYVKNNGRISIPFDDINTNQNAGLINKEHFSNYSGDWYDTLLSKFNVSSNDALANWNEIFGSKSVQPLIIVNKRRTDNYVAVKGATEDTFKFYYVKNEDNSFEKVAADANFDKNQTYYSLNDVINYGFVGSEKTISANSYSTVSVKVKVSKNAVAYIYLVDTSSDKKVLGFTAPSYTFIYDTDGNVLKSELDDKATLAEQRANILYTLRADGLYEDSEGKLYANLWNYTKLYTDESADYYDENGVKVSFDNLKEGETYYADAAKSKEANHFLVAKDKTKLYEFDGAYHYIVNNKSQKETVLHFEKQYAKYDYLDFSKDYTVFIDGRQEGMYDKWITVNFVIHAGSTSKAYRLELWSGERDKFITDGIDENGVVLFDYSYTTVSDDDVKTQYEDKIIKAYQKALAEKGLLKPSSSTENIRYYEKLVKGYIDKGELSQSDLDKYDILKNYKAYYYTYSFYDSDSFKPFNKEVTENATGYNYSVSNYSETLTYLSIDNRLKEDENSYTVFADYAAIDQSITLNTTSDEDEDTDKDEDKKESSTNIWLLASSILLVVVMAFTICAILIRDALKKARRKKGFAKNSKPASRYFKKSESKKEEAEEVNASDEAEQPEAVEAAEPEAEQPENTDTPDEQE